MKKQSLGVILAMGLTVATGSVFAATSLPASVTCTASGTTISCSVPSASKAHFKVLPDPPFVKVGTYVFTSDCGPVELNKSEGKLVACYVRVVGSSTSMLFVSNTTPINVKATANLKPKNWFISQHGHYYDCKPSSGVSPTACAVVFE